MKTKAIRILAAAIAGVALCTAPSARAALQPTWNLSCNNNNGPCLQTTNSAPNGNVYGIWAEAPVTAIVAIGDGSANALDATTTGNGVAIVGLTQTGQWSAEFNANVYVSGSVQQNSDIRLKTNVHPFDGQVALDKLLELRGVTYEWRKPDGQGHKAGVQHGFIAQDIEKVFPDWVNTDPDGFKTVSASALPIGALLVESVRELKKDNDALRERVQRLEARRTLTADLLGGTGVVGLLGLGVAAVLARRSARGASCR